MILAITSAIGMAVVGHSGMISIPQDAKPVKLRRVFAKGEKGEYEFTSSVLAETRDQVITTFMPERITFKYNYTYDVTDMKADGICTMRYKRPTISEITEEDEGPKTKVEKVNFDLQLDISPINDIIALKDLSPKKPEKGGGGLPLSLYILSRFGRAKQVDIIGQFVNEIHRLSLFIGSLDSSLDFAPKLPFDDDTVPGATWKRTVGYSPQKGTSSTGKMAVQRLDYVYTYVGLVDSGGKKVQRVTADMTLNTDLAQFIHDTYNLKPSQTGLKTVPMNFKTHLEYDLDPKTLKTWVARAVSDGGFSISALTGGNSPVLEERFTSTCKLKALTP